MATTTVDISNSCFSFGIPFSLFHKDLKQYSLRDLTEENKTFLWHQFMLDVLLNIPRSPTDIDDVIAIVEKESNSNSSNQNDIDNFRTTYTTDQAISWYTRDKFLYRIFNKACRTLNDDALVRLHLIVKDIDLYLKQLHAEQMENGTLKLPLTVYRGQAEWDKDELDRLLASEGCLISMNTFLSTTRSCTVACTYAQSPNPDEAVFFEITVKDTQNKKRFQAFADISQFSLMQHEDEVLFGMSSVFEVISIDKEDFFWYIKLELTSPVEDESVQQLMNEAKTYLYQISGKRMPFIVFKQLFTASSRNCARPLTELMNFFLSDVAQLFIVNAYKKEGRMKELIDKEPALHALVEQTSSGIVRQSETSICLLFDLFNSLLYSNDKDAQEPILFNNNDTESLQCFGGFLLLIGDCDKSIQYFHMLLKNDSINDKLKAVISAMLGASYMLTKEKEIASTYFNDALRSLQPSKDQFMPSWLTACIASSSTTLYEPNQPINPTLDMLEPLMNEEHIDNEVNEKLRLLHVGHVCFEQQKIVDALNHWEEAVEITSYMPSSLLIIFNGVIYVQMAVAYFRLSNMSEALNAMKKAIKCMESYYPSTHRMFAGLYFLYGYYLMQNDKPYEAIESLEKSLKNPDFSTDNNFAGIVHTLLVVTHMQSGNLDRAEQSCNQARKYESPTSVTSLVPDLRELISFLKVFPEQSGKDLIWQIFRNSLQIGQQLLTTIAPNSNTLPEVIDEQTCTYDKFITFADYYRHQHDFIKAETYYIKGLEKMTETEAKSMWVVYKKMMRMNKHDNDRYRDYFIEQYSKYDDNNPEHFEMIATLQIIMHKCCLSQNEYELAFDCLIYGTFMTVKFLYHQLSINPKYISDLFDRVFHDDQIVQATSILTKLIQMYSIEGTVFIRHILSRYFVSDDLYMNLAKIVHHSQIDSILDQMKVKCGGDDKTSESIFRFLDLLLQLLRQCITSTEKSTLSFSNQVLELLAKYNNENASLFYLVKTLESFFTDNKQSFLFNLDKLRLNTVTFECYKTFKEKISNVFGKLEEDQLRTCLESIAKNIVN